MYLEFQFSWVINSKITKLLISLWPTFPTIRIKLIFLPYRTLSVERLWGSISVGWNIWGPLQNNKVKRHCLCTLFLWVSHHLRRICNSLNFFCLERSHTYEKTYTYPFYSAYLCFPFCRIKSTESASEHSALFSLSKICLSKCLPFSLCIVIFKKCILLNRCCCK